MRFHQIITEKSKPSNPQLWGRAKAEAKKKYKVYPSAYANGYASKKYKEWGGTWTNESSQLDEITRPEYRQDAVEYLTAKGYTQIGGGTFADVFERKQRPSEVIKLFSTSDEAYESYLSFIMNNKDNPHFPRVIGKPMEITPDYYAVKLERLKPFKMTRVRELLTIDFYLNTEMINEETKKLFKNNPQLQHALDSLRDWIKNANGISLDLHSGNLMLRGDTIVLTDPVYSPHAMDGYGNEYAYTESAQLDEITRPPMMQDADARLRKAGYKRIGNGLYGAVYQKDKNTVVKTFTSKDKGYLAFIQMAKNSNNNPHFPRFFGNPIKVSPDYYAIKQENLREVPYELSNVYSVRWYIRTKANGGDVSNIGSELKEHFETFPRLQEACDMIANLIKQNPALYGEDSHIGNIMVRGGTYVFVDPISTTLSNDDAKEMPRISSWDTTVEEKPKDTKYKTEWDEIFKQLGNFDEKVEKLDEDLRDWDGYKFGQIKRKRQAQSKAGSKQTFVSTEPKK